MLLLFSFVLYEKNLILLLIIISLYFKKEKIIFISIDKLKIYIYISVADPTYVVTPIPQSPSSRENYKKLFAGN